MPQCVCHVRWCVCVCVFGAADVLPVFEPQGCGYMWGLHSEMYAVGAQLWVK